MLMNALFIVIIEYYSGFHTNINKGIFYIFFTANLKDFYICIILVTASYQLLGKWS